MKNFLLNTIEDASSVLEYFNYFHDGLIKKILIVSRDEIEIDKSQTCTGIFDIEIEFTHYNFNDGKPPYNQIIKSKFENVTGINIDLREVTIDWVINRIDILKKKQTTYQTKNEDYFALVLTRNNLTKSNEWELVKAELFTFTTAKFYM